MAASVAGGLGKLNSRPCLHRVPIMQCVVETHTLNACMQHVCTLQTVSVHGCMPRVAGRMQ
jgi:hypothetical protein